MLGNNGMGMILRAAGLDPDMLMAKGAELEASLKNFASHVQDKVESVDQRLARLEVQVQEQSAMLTALLVSVNQNRSAVLPAGESSEHLHAPVKTPRAITERKADTHGRNPGNSRTARSTRRAS